MKKIMVKTCFKIELIINLLVSVHDISSGGLILALSRNEPYSNGLWYKNRKTKKT